MSQNSYEVEIKCLLGVSDNAVLLVRRMREKDPELKELGSHRQLNHYLP